MIGQRLFLGNYSMISPHPHSPVGIRSRKNKVDLTIFQVVVRVLVLVAIVYGSYASLNIRKVVVVGGSIFLAWYAVRVFMAEFWRRDIEGGKEMPHNDDGDEAFSNQQRRITIEEMDEIRCCLQKMFEDVER